MAEAQIRNPELVKMVRESQFENSKYRFLFEDSPLHSFFLWRVREIQNLSINHSNTRPPPATDRPPVMPPHTPSPQPSYRPPRPPPIPGLQHHSNAHRPPPPPTQSASPEHWALLHPPPIPPMLAGASVTQPAALPQGDLPCHNNSNASAAAEPEGHSASRQYFRLPAGIMLKAISGDHKTYTPLCTEELEDPGFLETIVVGLSEYTEGMVSPEMTDELEQALEYFEKGVRYIYDEEEFGDQDHQSAGITDNQEDVKPIPIDREGWEPGILEKVLWDRRKSSAERQKWRRRQEREKRRIAGESVSESSDSSHSDSESDSTSYETSDSESSSSHSSTSSAGDHIGTSARPTNMNRAIGSENVGFKLLSKLGWQQGQGLGASSEGITEPIRPPTRFSNVRRAPRGGARRRGRGKRTVRASLGTGRREDYILDELTSPDGDGADATVNNEGNDQFEAYREQMSNDYKQMTASQRQRDSSNK
ncbi:hypothetical protein H4R24_004504 [Coemansia sp. RSA 988]|nr:hypothetical protein H4R24_004504 [Coemansia sp. RSA 988]